MTNGREEKKYYFWIWFNSSSVHIDGRNKNILFCGEGLTQVLDNAAITAEAKYLINFTEYPINFVKFAL